VTFTVTLRARAAISGLPEIGISKFAQASKGDGPNAAAHWRRIL
jgi:hypothetical protein